MAPLRAMNVHHLELIYFVARYGGVSAAVRAILYGIQQPAISAQIFQLVQSLGVTLNQRRLFLIQISFKGPALRAETVGSLVKIQWRYSHGLTRRRRQEPMRE